MITIKAEGRLINSSTNERAVSSIEGLLQSKDRIDILEGVCVECDKDNNLKIKLGRFIGFMPGSEISNDSIESYHMKAWSRVNKYLQFVITSIKDDEGGLNICLSRKIAMEMVHNEIMNKFKPGDYMNGIVKMISDDKVYLDIGCGNIAVLPVDKMNSTPEEEYIKSFNIGEEVEFRIDSINDTLIMADARDVLIDFKESIKNYKEGSFVTGIARMKTSAGIIIELSHDLKGIADHHRGVNYGDIVTVYIKKIDKEKRRIKLEIVDDDYETYKYTSQISLNSDNPSYSTDSAKSEKRKNQFEGKSPFSVIQGEKRVIESQDGEYVSFYQIMFDVKHEYINEIHYDILSIVMKHRYVTSKQITDFLNYKGERVSQDKVKRILKLCMRKALLERCYFIKDTGRSSYKVYSMAKNGASVLKYRGVRVYWTPLESVEKPEHIKKILATNQIIVGYMKCCPEFKGYKVNKLIAVEGNSLKVSALIFTDKEDYIYEVIRRKENWQRYVQEKMDKYKSIFSDINSSNTHFNKMPKFVICGEDEDHNREISDIIKKVELNNIDILYTYDKLNLEENFNKSLYKL